MPPVTKPPAGDEGRSAHDVNLAVQLGTNATAEATLGLDEYEPQRRWQSRSEAI